MSKKLKEVPEIAEMYKDDPEVIAMLTPADYWEWRTSIEEMKQQELKVELATLRQKYLETETKCLNLQAALFTQTLKQTTAQRDNYKKEYLAHIEKLENKYGVDLKDCIIGDINYEVRKTK
jgi:hypothetical protein